MTSTALRVARPVVAAAACVLIGGFLAGLVACVTHAQDRPDLLLSGPWQADSLRATLAELGVPVGWLVAYRAGLESAVAVTGCVAGLLVLRSGPATWFRLYVAFALVLYGTASGAVPSAVAMLYPALAPLAELPAAAWLAFFVLAYVFPDGRFVPRWTRRLLPAWAAMIAVLVLMPVGQQGVAVFLVFLILLASGVGAQVYRYRAVSGPTQRRQTRWVLAAVVLRFGYLVALLATPLGALINEASARGLVAALVTTGVSYGIAALFTASVAVAIVRHRLFDIDVVISRALVYAVLTAFIVGTYVVVVAGIGALVPAGGLLPVLAAAVVALAFSPVRERVQRRVTRLVFGARGEPGAVVAALAGRLGSTVVPDAVLPTIAETVGTALRCDRVEIALTDAEAVAHPPDAARPAGPPAGELDLRYDGDLLGVLRVWRPERLVPAERGLLENVAGQAGIAVRAARITAELRRSREHILAAREEERARLHRDLHDGLGPTMASLYQRVDAAAECNTRDPAAAQRLLGEVKRQIQQTIGEIRELVYALRPPVLDELGLVPAVEDMCLRLGDRLHIDVAAAALPPLPAMVEVVAYRIVVESVTNAVRHASARRCDVAFAHGSGTDLLVTVTDDGVGLPEPLRSGAGVRSMRERADEVGGTITFTANRPTGTVVHARLPLGSP